MREEGGWFRVVMVMMVVVEVEMGWFVMGQWQVGMSYVSTPCGR